MISTFCKDPFRLFFPISVFCLIYASSLWALYGIFEIGEFPLQEHANLFFGGFLFFAIHGFLLTAIPRFTATNFMSPKELFLYVVVIISILLFYFVGNQTNFWLGIFAGWILLINFGMRRFIKRKQNPPFTFIFIASGLLLGLLGSFFNFLSTFNSNAFSYLEGWGKLFFYDAMVTSFILGVGGRLIPGILGFTEIVKEQRKIYEQPQSFLSIIPKDIWFALFTFILSLVLEGKGLEQIAYICRATVISYFTIKYWQIHRASMTEKWHGRMLKLSCFFLVIASWLLCFFIDEAIHFKHLIYIGSYCLMTLMVASRVIVAHGNEGFEIENKMSPFLVVGLLTSAAALTRVSAFFMPDSYIRHLGYAGSILLLGSCIWAFCFIRKVFSFNK